jgi:hypothetical protein
LGPHSGRKGVKPGIRGTFPADFEIIRIEKKKEIYHINRDKKFWEELIASISLTRTA